MDGLAKDQRNAINEVLNNDWTQNDLPILFRLLGTARAYKRPLQLLEQELAHFAEVIEQEKVKKENENQEPPIDA